MSERDLRNQLCELGASLYERGLTCGSSGNLSVKTADAILITPTNSCLGRLDSARISKISLAGEHVSGDPPSKEAFLHLAMYRARAADSAVVHLHPTWSVAISCLANLPPEDCLPALTPYFVMRIGRLPLVPYRPPGDPALAGEVQRYALTSRAILLANHGPVVAGKSLDDAVTAMEELEETAKLFLMLSSHATNVLTAEQCDELRRRFPQ